MEEEEEDDDSCDGAIEGPSPVASNVEEPEEKREAHGHQRKQQVDEQIDVDVLHSLAS